jgi:hypothetical protein
MSSGKKTTRGSATGHFTIGWDASKHVSAIEGLKLSKGMSGTFMEFEKSGKSPAARRAGLAAKYGKRSDLLE